jgi:hypothetical protein
MVILSFLAFLTGQITVGGFMAPTRELAGMGCIATLIIMAILSFSLFPLLKGNSGLLQRLEYQADQFSSGVEAEIKVVGWPREIESPGKHPLHGAKNQGKGGESPALRG